MSRTFSEFLNLLELRGASWCKVDFGPSGGFTIAKNEQIFFYAALQGTARIAGVGGGMLQLDQGGIALILSGEAHAVRNQPGAATQTIDFLRGAAYSDAPVSFTLGEPGPVTTRLLCGRLKPTWPSGLPRRSLPAAVTVGLGESLVDCESMEKAATGSGSAALLTRIASLTLVSALRGDPQCERLFLASATNDPVARALQLIDRHSHQPWTVSSLARSVGMGRSNFAARFTAEVGRTPMEVLAERRMHVAAELLQTNELKIVEVGSRVGYLSEAAFSRRFTRHFGMSPGQMRIRARKRGTMAVNPPERPAS